MSGKKLQPHERLAACFLFFFRAGVDAKDALSDGAKRVGVPLPSDEDLEQVMEDTGIGTWKGVEPFAEAVARSIAEQAPRDPMSVARDVVDVVRRGQQALEKFAGPAGSVDINGALRQHFSGKRGRK